MDFVYIGKIVGTHGIKGELRLISNFDKKELVFKQGVKIYIGRLKEEHEIITYRKHKKYDMIVLDGLNDINLVLKYKGLGVYVDRKTLDLGEDGYVLDDLLGMKVECSGKYFGIVENIFDNNGATLLKIRFEKNYYIPYNKRYIKKVLLGERIVIVEDVKDLIL